MVIWWSLVVIGGHSVVIRLSFVVAVVGGYSVVICGHLWSFSCHSVVIRGCCSWWLFGGVGVVVRCFADGVDVII